MSENSKKKDLTGLENLAPYLHELNAEDDATEFSQEPQTNPSFSLVENPLPEDENPIGELFQEISAEFGEPEHSETPAVIEPTKSFNATESSELDEVSEESTVGTTPGAEEGLARSIDHILEIIDDEMESQEMPQEQSSTYQPSSFSQHFADEEEPLVESTPIQPETFEDLTDVAESMQYSAAPATCNPPYTLVIRGIEDQESAQDIRELLKEHKLYTPENSVLLDKSLEQGVLLLSQISEFAAIFLAHKLRHLTVDLCLGPSEEIRPVPHDPSQISEPLKSRGSTTKASLWQNKSETFAWDEGGPVPLESIILTTLERLEGRSIHRYLGIITEHQLLTEVECQEYLRGTHSFDLDKTGGLAFDQESKIDNDETPVQFDVLYDDLGEKLRRQAFRLQGNAVIGIQYQFTPMQVTTGMLQSKGTVHYKLTCTGNVVWAS